MSLALRPGKILRKSFMILPINLQSRIQAKFHFWLNNYDKNGISDLYIIALFGGLQVLAGL